MQAQSNARNIDFKQLCLFDQNGIMDFPKPDPEPSAGSFRVHNKFAPFSFAVNADLGGEHLPVYISPTSMTDAYVKFEPVSTVQVWFSLQDKTSTMISDISGDPFLVDFTGGATTAHIAYEGPEPGKAKWTRVE